MVLIILILVGILVFNKCYYEKAGKIKDGKVIYSDKITITNKHKDKEIIEIKSVDKFIDNLIITNIELEDMKVNKEKYNRTLKDVLSDDNIHSKDVYNINKAIELDLVTEDTKLIDYYAKITGLKNKKVFIKFCEDAFKLIEEDGN